MTLTVQSDRLHTRGGLRDAARLAKKHGVPVQHMNPHGTVTVIWFESGKRRQKTHKDVVVQHVGVPTEFFLK